MANKVKKKKRIVGHKLEYGAWPTDLFLKMNYPKAWEMGFKQGRDPKRKRYRSPYTSGTYEQVAFNTGCWRGFCELDRELLLFLEE